MDRTIEKDLKTNLTLRESRRNDVDAHTHKQLRHTSLLDYKDIMDAGSDILGQFTASDDEVELTVPKLIRK